MMECHERIAPTADRALVLGVNAKLPTADDVIGAYWTNGTWGSLLEGLGSRQDVPAVEALEGLLDFALDNQLADLQEKVAHCLSQFSRYSTGYHAAQLVHSSTVDGILHAFNASSERAGDKKPIWERALHRVAAGGGGDALRVLGELSKSDRPRLSDTARGCLRKMQDTAEPSIHANINQLLGTTVPRRKEGVATVADGDCLLHALLGQRTDAGYRCDSTVIQGHRDRVAAALKQYKVEQMSDTLAMGLAGFYCELVNVAILDEGRPPPNEKFLLGSVQVLKDHLTLDGDFQALSCDSKQAVLNEYAALHAEPGFFFSLTLIPLVASLMGLPISLYVDEQGWRHVASDGNEYTSLLPDAVAIRFNAGMQHFERVEPPLLEHEDEFSNIDEGEISQLPHALQYNSSKFIASSGIGFALSPNKELDELPASPTSTRPHSLPSSKPESRLAIVPLRTPKPTEAAAPRPPVKESWFARFFSWFSRFF